MMELPITKQIVIVMYQVLELLETKLLKLPKMQGYTNTIEYKVSQELFGVVVTQMKSTLKPTTSMLAYILKTTVV